jgi:histidyl-tRNA synthetase
MQDMVNGAPKLLDYLGEESLAHFNGVRKILDHNNIPYTDQHRAWCAVSITTTAPCSNG